MYQFVRNIITETFHYQTKNDFKIRNCSFYDMCNNYTKLSHGSYVPSTSTSTATYGKSWGLFIINYSNTSTVFNVPIAISLTFFTDFYTVWIFYLPFKNIRISSSGKRYRWNKIYTIRKIPNVILLKINCNFWKARNVNKNFTSFVKRLTKYFRLSAAANQNFSR